MNKSMCLIRVLCPIGLHKHSWEGDDFMSYNSKIKESIISNSTTSIASLNCSDSCVISCSINCTYSCANGCVSACMTGCVAGCAVNCAVNCATGVGMTAGSTY